MVQLEDHRICGRPYGHCKQQLLFLALCLSLVCPGAYTCSPGRSGARRRSIRKLTPLVFKQHMPNIPENSLGASGPSEDRVRRDDARFKELVLNYNPEIVFKDKRGNGADRVMTQRCKEKLDNLAISVMNQWPSVRLRVTEGFDEDGFHAPQSLHYSGRAVDITTSDRDPSKYGMLARLAVEAGFDWVYFESRSHIHCSVKKEAAIPSKNIGCFHGSSIVLTKKGPMQMKDLKEGDEVASNFLQNGQLSYSKVIAFLHKDSNMEAVFVQLLTDSDNILTLTQRHLVFKWINQTPEATYAIMLKKGDSIYSRSVTGENKLSVITNITLMVMKGVYAPLTESGTILVDRVLVSCYAEVASHELAHAALFPVRFLHVISSFAISFYSEVQDYLDISSYMPSYLAKIAGYPLTMVLEKGELHWYPRILCWIFSPYFIVFE
ncbi:sonic hedgehog protein A [Caerostris darwini]|uniref:Hedgehog protein n=1 Tax=Caerostris darwini TaxID=1538125 RepID=A0AAV4VQR6_9ARAC|nr:sonic hedgehog protein A [Caerostris darwini]